jgi:hypothetical protein
MAQKLIIDFLHDWIRNETLRKKVLHKELTHMKIPGGLDDGQIQVLTGFEIGKIAEQIAKELGLDLDDLREAVYGKPSETGGTSGAAYDEGRTHIRRIVPAVVAAVSAPQTQKIVLWGHGFHENASDVTVQFTTGSAASPTVVQTTPTHIEYGVDVWQRVTVEVTLSVTGDWDVHAFSTGDLDKNGQRGTIHVV